MASGCIVGDCPYCKDWVFEDDWILDRFDRVCHTSCKSKGNTIKSNVEWIKSQLEIAVEALELMDDRKRHMLPRSEMAKIAKAAIDRIKGLPDIESNELPRRSRQP